MSKNTGTPYEKLTQQVFQAIHAGEGITNIDVQHDVVLQGKTATHQIDVFWEFEHAGIRYRTIVQCKDWQSPVKQEQVFAMKAVLEDLPGQPRGIIVSRAGFQQGARDFAEAHGIVLYELREPKDSDWEGHLLGVEMQMEMHVPVVHSFRLVQDDTWIREEKKRLGLTETISFEIRTTLGETVFRREDESVIANAGDLVEQLTPSECKRAYVEHRFDESAFIDVEHPVVKRLKLLGFDVDIEDAVALRQVLRIDLHDFVRLILKDVAKGTFRKLDAEGRPFATQRPARLDETEGMASGDK